MAHNQGVPRFRTIRQPVLNGVAKVEADLDRNESQSLHSPQIAACIAVTMDSCGADDDA